MHSDSSFSNVFKYIRRTANYFIIFLSINKYKKKEKYSQRLINFLVMRVYSAAAAAAAAAAVAAINKTRLYICKMLLE